jgi:hypothetical protein
MEDTNSTFKRNALLVGGIVGALIGVVAANVIVKAAEQEAEGEDGELAITPAKGLKLGMLVLGLLRQISDI